MLTKTDLKEISEIVKGSESRIKKDVISEVNKKITTETRKIQKNLEEMDKFLDKEVMTDRKRIIRIEEHLNFPQN
jgi:intergrase/recombinase